MDSSETTEIERTRRIRRIAVISVITLVILVLIAVGIYLIAFVILSPMIGVTGGPSADQAHHGHKQIPIRGDN
jgi:hypothetical protein